MAEIYTWREGSAYFWTGDSTTSALATFARNATVTPAVNRHSYRPPFATTRTYIEIERGAGLDISQAFSQKTLADFFQNAAGGVAHCHIKHVEQGGGLSGGIFLYSGELQTMTLGGSDGAEIQLSIRGQFQVFSGY